MDQTTRRADEQLQRFLIDGYVLLRDDTLPDSLHRALFDGAAELYDEVGRTGGTTTHLTHLGDNLRARLPALDAMLASPALQEVLRAILGEGALLHPHHFVHRAGRTDQGWHQDGNLPWNARGHLRSHRPVEALVVYYPQDVTEDLGPTEVLPGTQYWTGRFEDGDAYEHDDRVDRSFDSEAGRHADLASRDARLAAARALLPNPAQPSRLVVPAGSIVVTHYDLVHRGTRQAPQCDAPRFMYKFTYLRTQEPAPATAPCRHLALRPDDAASDPQLVDLARRVWGWLQSDAAPLPAPQLVACTAGLRSTDEATRHRAAHELGWCGEAAVGALRDALADERAVVRRAAAFGLGETRSTDAAATASLAAALDDADELVRSNAAFALGGLARVAPLGATALDALLARLDPAVEPDNVANAALPRSTVRECVAGALLQAACQGALDDIRLDRLATLGLADIDRYVQGLTVLALRAALDGRLPRWGDRLVEHLAARRYVTAPDGDGSPPPLWGALATTAGRPGSISS